MAQAPSLSLSQKIDACFSSISAGPIEGLRERMTWLGVSLEDDVFGKALLDAGVDRELLRRVCDNASILLPDGSRGPAFDLLEDRDSSDVASLLRQAQLD